MTEDLEIVKSSGSLIVYKLDRVSRIDDEFLNGLDWPEGIRAKVFVLGEVLKNEKRVAGRVSDKKRVWFMYYSLKEELASWDPKLPADIKSVPLGAHGALERVYTATREGYYRARGQTMTARQQEENRRFLSLELPHSRHYHLEKNGKTAAFVLLNDHRDYMGEPGELIPWLWIDLALPVEERKFLAALLCAWLKKNVKTRVMDFTSLACPELHEFDRAIGLYPAAIYVLKEN